MSGNPTGADPGRNEVNQSIILGAVVGQVGCLTLLLVLAALFGGLWLDKIFGTKPLVTVIAMIASVPVTLVLMFWIVRRATNRLQATRQPDSEKKGEGGALQ
jgi:hypothetical protein